MNQILVTNLSSENTKFKKIKKILKFQFYFSIILIFSISLSIIYNKKQIIKKEKFSDEVLNNYNITKLYSNVVKSNEDLEDSYILGIIEIPKINILYPIFSNYNDELLKICPCRFFGPQPGKVGNLCIAGHNYDNDKFFSKISDLEIYDQIIIYNNSNKPFSYFVLNIFEVDGNDLSPIYNYNKNDKILTLITCNNINKKRIVVRASM